MSLGGRISQTSRYCGTLKIPCSTKGENKFPVLSWFLSHRNTSLSKYTWHTFKYLKQPPGGLYLCNWTNVTGRHTTLYTTHSTPRKCPKFTAIKTLKEVKRSTKYWSAILFLKSCTESKSMLGLCSRKDVTGNQTSLSIRDAGVQHIDTARSVSLACFPSIDLWHIKRE